MVKEFYKNPCGSTDQYCTITYDDTGKNLKPSSFECTNNVQLVKGYSNELSISNYGTMDTNKPFLFIMKNQKNGATIKIDGKTTPLSNIYLVTPNHSHCAGPYSLEFTTNSSTRKTITATWTASNGNYYWS